MIRQNLFQKKIKRIQYVGINETSTTWTRPSQPPFNNQSKQIRVNHFTCPFECCTRRSFDIFHNMKELAPETLLLWEPWAESMVASLHCEVLHKVVVEPAQKSCLGKFSGIMIVENKGLNGPVAQQTKMSSTQIWLIMRLHFKTYN